MKIPLYILGLLLRFGPQHGYQIKKICAEQFADFTQIKLPTIYYHLEKMEQAGLLNASTGKDSNRPEKTIYAITDKGQEAFQHYLHELLHFDYRPTFSSDAVFYFSEAVDPALIREHLQTYRDRLQHILRSILQHKMEALSFLPEEAKKMALMIFSHHEHHYQAELDWVQETLTNLESH
jgi:DNA-binding PadR family transcriptional regulator